MLDKPILTGKTIILRPIGSADAEALMASMDDGEVNRLTGTQASFTLEQVREFYGRVAEADDRVDYAIVLPDSPEQALGEVVLNDIDWTNRTSNFRIALFHSADFGKGYGTEATELIVAFGFEQLNLHRIELEVYDFNPRAAHVYEKVGFVREGVRRDVLLWDGVYQSAIVMSLLQPEYAARKQVQ